MRAVARLNMQPPARSEIEPKWRVKVADKAYGPYSKAQLETYVADDRVTSRTLVARVGDSHWRPAKQDPNLAALFQVSAPTARTGFSKVAETEAGPANFILVFELTSGAGARIEETIRGLGKAYALTSSVWLLTTEATLGTIRNQITPQLRENDKFFIADASRDKAGWHNLGPEAEARLKQTWRRA